MLSANAVGAFYAATLNRAAVFPDAVFRTLQIVCDLVIPRDEVSGSACEAGVPEFIAYIASKSAAYHQRIAGFVMWLNSFCSVQYGVQFSDGGVALQLEIIALIAYRKNLLTDPRLAPGIEAFRPVRRAILDAYYTSRIGIQDLGFKGNQVVQEFSGCPVDIEQLMRSHLRGGIDHAGVRMSDGVSIGATASSHEGP